MIAHIAGLPVEELFVPLASVGGGLLVAARLLVGRTRPRRRRARHD
jgi:hypothetical protein